MTKTLEQEFPFPKKLKKQTYKHQHEVDLLRAYQFIEILRFIVANEAQLEHRLSSDREDWHDCSIRNFLKFATFAAKSDDPKQTGFSDNLKFYRIKRIPQQVIPETIATIKQDEQ